MLIGCIIGGSWSYVIGLKAIFSLTYWEMSITQYLKRFTSGEIQSTHGQQKTPKSGFLKFFFEFFMFFQVFRGFIPSDLL